MSQEIQLALNQNLPAPASPFSTGLAMSASAQPTPLQKAHGLLRGRYLLAFVLATIFSVLGAAAGFLLLRPSMESVGVIEIKPYLIMPGDWDRMIPMYQTYVASVVAKLQSERVISEAMRSPEWLAHRSNDAAASAEFSKNLTVKFLPNTELVQINFTDDKKDAKEVCPIAVKAIIDAYDHQYRSHDNDEFNLKLSLWDKKARQLNQEIHQKREVIDRLAAGVGEDPQNVIGWKWQQLVKDEYELRIADQQLADAEQDLKAAEPGNGGTPAYTVEDLAKVDMTMQGKIQMRTTLELEYQQNRQLTGDMNPRVKNIKASLDSVNQYIEKYAQQLRDKYFIKWRPDGTGGVLIPKDLTTRRMAVARMHEQYNQQKQAMEDLTQRSTQLGAVKEDLKKLDTELTFASKRIEDLTAQRDMAETYAVVNYGEHAKTAADKRLAFTALGFMAGGGLPIGLLLLAGLLNPRYRFSDETTAQQSMGGLTLLGILPDLPDRLSDPEQASIAAHCVHQIRTMLQINGAAEERRVFAVTSAAPGDGKTSLTLALGLSYAACGTRTLLIDCDLVGAGLSSRMNVNTAEGVLEAIANRSMMEYVHATDIADVSILPVGSAQALHASTLSPQALRRLIDEAKKNFDTILIDTGPVLGSIEASLVAAAADAVVLTVSRGQQRPLVEKAISHLVAIGARLAGVVFNRAQSADFDRSISGLSLRSVSAAQQGTRMGPVARAVQTAFRPGEE